MKKFILLLILICISFGVNARNYDVNQEYDGKVSLSIGAGACVGGNPNAYGGPMFFSTLKYNWLMLGAICSIPIQKNTSSTELYPSIGVTFSDNSSVFIGPVMDLSAPNNNVFQLGAIIGGHITAGKHMSVLLYLRGREGTKYDEQNNPTQTFFVEGGMGLSFDLHWLTF